MIEIENYQDMFTDAAVADEQGNLIFASIWARSAHINALYGRIVNQELRKLVIDGKEYAVNKDLQKAHQRLPKENAYGSDLCHAFIYAGQTREARAGRRYLLGNKVSDSQIWKCVCHLSDIALQPHWRLTIMHQLVSNQSVTELEQTYNIQACFINLSDKDKFEAMISDLIKSQVIAA